MQYTKKNKNRELLRELAGFVPVYRAAAEDWFKNFDFAGRVTERHAYWSVRVEDEILDKVKDPRWSGLVQKITYDYRNSCVELRSFRSTALENITSEYSKKLEDAWKKYYNVHYLDRNIPLPSYEIAHARIERINQRTYRLGQIEITFNGTSQDRAVCMSANGKSLGVRYMIPHWIALKDIPAEIERYYANKQYTSPLANPIRIATRLNALVDYSKFDQLSKQQKAYLQARVSEIKHYYTGRNDIDQTINRRAVL